MKSLPRDLFQRFDKSAIADGAPGFRMFAQSVKYFRCVIFCQITRPVGDALMHWGGVHEFIRRGTKMCMNARPAPFVWALAQAGAHWIKLDVSNGCEQVRFIQNARIKTFLP